MSPPSRAAASHLLPALAALLAVAALLATLEVRATSCLRRFGPRLAALNLPEETRGTVLQQRVFAMSACLPVYGSSELTVAQPTRADLFFRRRRQGFDVRVIGQAGDHCLPMLQELASLGETAREKRVALFLSPNWFLPAPEARQRDHAAHTRFAATFSPLQAGRLAVDPTFDHALKREIAARLLSNDPVIQERSPLLDFALTCLQQPGWVGRGLFVAAVPLLTLQNEMLSFQESCHWLELTGQPAALPRTPAGFRPRRKHQDWTQLAREVNRAEAKRTHETFYSRGPALDTSPELRHAQSLADYPDEDADFLRRMDSARGWIDLDLLLRVARARGIRLLLIDQPINGLFSNYQGITAQARQEYYQRVRTMAAAHHVPMEDFSAYEEDRTFFMDLVHPSAAAWVRYDQALAEFFRPKHG